MLTARATDGNGNTVASPYHRLRIGSTIRFNFQPKDETIPTSHLMDYRQGYGKQDNGKTYGWSEVDDFEEVSIDYATTDTRLATWANLGEETWEMALRNGIYDVELTLGPARKQSDDLSVIIEGAIIDGTPTGRGKQTSYTTTTTIEVMDGRLSLRAAEDVEQARISSIAIKPSSNDRQAQPPTNRWPIARQQAIWAWDNRQRSLVGAPGLSPISRSMVGPFILTITVSTSLMATSTSAPTVLPSTRVSG